MRICPTCLYIHHDQEHVLCEWCLLGAPMEAALDKKPDHHMEINILKHRDEVMKRYATSDAKVTFDLYTLLLKPDFHP